MKKSRLLEIIHEEISNALNEVEQIAEMASMKQLKTQLEKHSMSDELKAVEAAEIATIEKLKLDPVFSGEGNNQRLKGYVKNLKKELKDTHDINLQSLLSDVAEKAEVTGDKFNDDIATNTIEKDAANKVLGKEPGKRGRKADPNKPTKPKKEKTIGSDKKEKPKKTSKKETSSDDEAPSGDAGVEKAARSQDKLIAQFQKEVEPELKDKIKKSKEGDKEAMAWLKSKQDIIKKYNKSKKVEA